MAAIGSHELGPRFELTISASGPNATIGVAGELDLATAPKLQEALAQAIADSGEVLIDFSRCTFIDSTGLSAIVAAARRLDEDGRRLAITALRGQPLNVFGIAGLTGTTLIEIRDPG